MSEKPNETIDCVRVRASGSNAEVLRELLAATCSQNASEWADPDGAPVVFTFYCTESTAATQLRDAIAARIASWQQQELLHGDPIPVTTDKLQREDWANSWKRYFHTFKASRRLVIKPSWEDYAAAPGELVLEIDPGMSFGTGYHPTTRACLQLLDQLAETFREQPLLDAGCGSGILSMAAWKLGFRQIYAFDHDPQATLMARENLVRAGAAEAVAVTAADIEDYEPPRRCPLVIANILAHVLDRNAERLAAYLDSEREDHALVLSGIMTSQYAGVRKRFESLGLGEVERLTFDDWTTGCYRRTG